MPDHHSAKGNYENATPGLPALLSQWAATEPERCRQVDDFGFEVRYAACWLKASADPGGHGAIIASVLEGCQQHQIYCDIEFTPRDEEQPPTVEVGCVHKVFRWDEGDEAVYAIPTLLLAEYLERLCAQV
jgi:hypothetical protein